MQNTDSSQIVTTLFPFIGKKIADVRTGSDGNPTIQFTDGKTVAIPIIPAGTTTTVSPESSDPKSTAGGQ